LAATVKPVTPDDPADLAITHGMLGDPTHPDSGDEIIVAVWRAVRHAVVLVLRHDPDAEPGSNWEAFPELFVPGPDGRWDYTGAGGFDFPVEPGERPSIERGDPPLWLSGGSSWDSSGLFVTFAVAAVEIAAVDINSHAGTRRSQVGHFGAVILSAETTPADVTLIGHDGQVLPLDTRRYRLTPWSLMASLPPLRTRGQALRSRSKT
jgi:hypothetical protein